MGTTINPNLKAAYDWLNALGLAVEPWCFTGSSKTLVPVPELPSWVLATYAGWTLRPDPAHWPGALDDADARPWQDFLLLASRMPGLRGQLESVYRLGGTEGAATFVNEHVTELARRMREDTRVLAALRVLQVRRMRRISGRPGFAGDNPKRPSDAEFAREALPPRVKKGV